MSISWIFFYWKIVDLLNGFTFQSDLAEEVTIYIMNDYVIIKSLESERIWSKLQESYKYQATAVLIFTVGLCQKRFMTRWQAGKVFTQNISGLKIFKCFYIQCPKMQRSVKYFLSTEDLFHFGSSVYL